MKNIIILSICILCLLATTTAGAKEVGLPQESGVDSTTAAQVKGSEITRVSQAAAVFEYQTGKLYGIGSVSKIFTTAAVMKLAENGLLDIDEPITTYIPDFVMADARYALITPRMLLNHSSGLMGSTADNAYLVGDNDTYLHDHFLELLKTQTLKHDPGDRSIYSNDSFTLAEILVERVSGMSYTDFITLYFAQPLGLENIETPQSDFDWDKLAYTYLGNSGMKPQEIGVIGAGGIYATVEDLCRFATIFMDSSDGSVLSKASVEEMSKSQHQMELVPPGSDSVFRYGLGWDCVEQYPFNRFDIKALSKGGSTFAYFTNLTVLPEYDLAAAVACSGAGGLESLIAQEIILAVLEEEGLIPGGVEISLPEQNMNRATVPESMNAYAGVYAAGMFGQYNATFTEDSLILTPVGVRNERPMEFVFNTDGEFVSTNGDYIGINTSVMGAVGITALTFEGDYIMLQTYESIPGLSNTAVTMPFAERIAANPIPRDVWSEWVARNDQEYLLVSEKHTSGMYISMPVVKTLADERVYGYVSHGIYTGGGVSFPAARISDANTANGYQNTPTMMGRDITNITVEAANSMEYLCLNGNRFVDAAAAVPFSTLVGKVVIDAEPVWVDIDSGLGGKTISVTTPENGSWFVYDYRMNCIATSLEANLRTTIILPENGRLLFAGEQGSEFTINFLAVTMPVS